MSLACWACQGPPTPRYLLCTSHVLYMSKLPCMRRWVNLRVELAIRPQTTRPYPGQGASLKLGCQADNLYRFYLDFYNCIYSKFIFIYAFIFYVFINKELFHKYLFFSFIYILLCPRYCCLTILQSRPPQLASLWRHRSRLALLYHITRSGHLLHAYSFITLILAFLTPRCHTNTSTEHVLTWNRADDEVTKRDNEHRRPERRHEVIQSHVVDHYQNVDAHDDTYADAPHSQYNCQPQDILHLCKRCGMYGNFRMTGEIRKKMVPPV